LKKYLVFFSASFKTINIERELTELQNKKQASNREEIENRINLLENELKTFYEKKTEGALSLDLHFAHHICFFVFVLIFL
jgi:hypothetical protein